MLTTEHNMVCGLPLTAVYCCRTPLLSEDLPERDEVMSQRLALELPAYLHRVHNMAKVTLKQRS